MLAARLGRLGVVGRAPRGRMGAVGRVLGGYLGAGWHAPECWLGAPGCGLSARCLGRAICSPGGQAGSGRLIGDGIWPGKELV